MALKFEDPTPDGRGSTDWKPILDELRANPGRWALVAENAVPSTAINIKAGRTAGAVAGEFEAVSRSIKGTTRANIYARYTGGH